MLYLSVGSSAAAAAERVGHELPHHRADLHQRDIHPVPGDGQQLELAEHAEGLGHAPAGHVDGDGAPGDPVVGAEHVGDLHPGVLAEELAELGVDAEQRGGRGGGEEEDTGVERGWRGSQRGERERERVEAGGERAEGGGEAEWVRERGGGEVEQREVRAGGGVDEAAAQLPPRQRVPRLEHLVLQRRVEVELDGVVPGLGGGGGGAGGARGGRGGGGDRRGGGGGGDGGAAAGGGRGALRHVGGGGAAARLGVFFFLIVGEEKSEREGGSIDLALSVGVRGTLGLATGGWSAGGATKTLASGARKIVLFIFIYIFIYV